MKINKKFTIATTALLAMAGLSTVILTSCSQGATPNLTASYALKIGGEDFRINQGIFEKKNGDKWEAPTPIDWKKYKIQEYNPSDDKTFPNIATEQQPRAKEALSLMASQYIINSLNEYLHLLTTRSDEDIKKLTGVEKEFQLAYKLGVGISADTYRLRIKSVEMNLSSEILKENWSYGKEVPLDQDKKPEIPTENIQITGIKISLGYYKATGGSGIQDIEDIKVIQNSNWQQYWKNFNPEEPKNIGFDLNIPGLTLNLKVKPNYIAYLPPKTDQVPKPEVKYAYSGTVTLDGFEQSMTSQPLSWPMWWGNLKYYDTKTKAEVIVDDATKQNAFNTSVKNTIEAIYDNQITWDDLKNKQEYSTTYNSLSGAVSLNSITGNTGTKPR